MSNLHLALDQLNDEELLQYLHLEIELKNNQKELMIRYENDMTKPSILQNAIELGKSQEVILKLIEMGGKELLYQKCNGQHALHAACMVQAPADVIVTLADVGGSEFVLEKSSNGSTALHYAIWRRSSFGVVKKLVEVGGSELVLIKAVDGGNSLHRACRCYLTSIDTIKYLIDAGGREIVMAKDHSGNTPLHFVCAHSQPFIQAIMLIIEIGGGDIVMEKDNHGNTPLHVLCQKMKNIPASRTPAITEAIIKLIDIGGYESVMSKNKEGNTPLHMACSHRASIEVIVKLVKLGGHELIKEKNKCGEIAWSYGYGNFIDHTTLLFMMKEGLNAQLGGEFGIGGLFIARDTNIQQEIYRKWKPYIAPCFQKVMASFEQKTQLSILHAAIMAKAPKHVIHDTINCFDCILSKDSLDRYPIHVAVVALDCPSLGEETERMKQIMDIILKATARAQCRPVINVAAEYGLKWNEYVKELAESHMKEAVDEYDDLTGLRLFMLAAMGSNGSGYCDLNSIYGLMRISPEI